MADTEISTIQGEARQGGVWFGEARPGPARQGGAGQGLAGQGEARQGLPPWETMGGAF